VHVTGMHISICASDVVFEVLRLDVLWLDLCSRRFDLLLQNFFPYVFN